MGYVGGSLVSLFNETPQKLTKAAAHSMAEKAGERMVDLATINTPIATGRLRESWYQLPTHSTSFGVWEAYESGVASNVDYAPHVEYGTGLWGPKHAKYPIEAKNGGFLRWVDPRTGQEVFARRVMHPGSPGQHMVATAADVTEFEADTGMLFSSILNDWARGVEAAAD